MASSGASAPGLLSVANTRTFSVAFGAPMLLKSAASSHDWSQCGSGSTRWAIA